MYLIVELPNIPIFNNNNEKILNLPIWYVNNDDLYKSKYFLAWCDYIGYNIIKNIE